MKINVYNVKNHFALQNIRRVQKHVRIKLYVWKRKKYVKIIVIKIISPLMDFARKNVMKIKKMKEN